MSELTPEEPLLPRRWYHRVGGASRLYASRLLMILVVVLFVVIYFWRDVFITVNSGQVAVLYLRFGGGTQTDRVLGEGLKIIAPWDKLFIYDVRVQETKHTMDVLTSEGLSVNLSLSIRYHPEAALVGLLQANVGPDYKEKIVIPEVESALRTTMANFPMRDVYGSQRGLVQQAINESLEKVQQKFVSIDEVVLREVELPAQIRDTVEQKMTQKELAESYEYRLDVARREAERRQIEATGLKNYNDTLNSSLTPNVLKWEGIEATKELAKSPNAKTIVIGSQGSAGLPLILGSDLTK
jgi:regulator of protease activity HflC (stomatin/prohibitin superfamily)